MALGPQSGLMMTGDNEIVDIAEILGARIRAGSMVGVFPVTTTAKPLRLGATNLVERHTVYVINTGTATCYVGFTTGVTSENGIPIGVGDERGFFLDPNENLDLFIISTANTTVRLLEVK